MLRFGDRGCSVDAGSSGGNGALCLQSSVVELSSVRFVTLELCDLGSSELDLESRHC